MRFSVILALLPLALATPIPDNRSSRQSNRIKDIGNKQADVANQEVADIQRAESAIKNKQSPKAAEKQLAKDLNHGIELRKQNQNLLKKLPGNPKRDVTEHQEEDGDEEQVGGGEEREPAAGEGQVVEIRPTLPDVQREVESPQPRDRTLIQSRASKKQAIATQNGIEQKQKAATKSVKSLKGTAADSATLASLKSSFQNGNAKLSAFTGQVPGRK
ncbi:hypothetical protein PpBr36_04171 [Pyricularia pennisetigena]|uniref:hypothetical protein n=1 Tax=Pyricularia pennisetigena TaxID=1578925 RepID=UPI001153C8D6|nr:hypothetical protein PpBr36_04171 [Pyricularia pennisetigena]TLS26743.1 hypothetical protein PpBr36_04171 [Pyricularia pennisetigena]